MSIRLLVATLTCLLFLTACDREPGFLSRCKRNVELRLTAPNTAKYGSIRGVAPNPNNFMLRSLDKHGYFGSEATGTHVWLAYVDSNNALGATVRNYIACIEDSDGFNLEVAPGIGALSIFIE